MAHSGEPERAFIFKIFSAAPTNRGKVKPSIRGQETLGLLVNILRQFGPVGFPALSRGLHDPRSALGAKLALLFSRQFLWGATTRRFVNAGPAFFLSFRHPRTGIVSTSWTKG
jgi:hypothetical protein